MSQRKKWLPEQLTESMHGLLVVVTKKDGSQVIGTLSSLDLAGQKLTVHVADQKIEHYDLDFDDIESAEV